MSRREMLLQVARNCTPEAGEERWTFGHSVFEKVIRGNRSRNADHGALFINHVLEVALPHFRQPTGDGIRRSWDLFERCFGGWVDNTALKEGAVPQAGDILFLQSEFNGNTVVLSPTLAVVGKRVHRYTEIHIYDSGEAYTEHVQSFDDACLSGEVLAYMLLGWFDTDKI
jgi:hypothetical protein